MRITLAIVAALAFTASTGVYAQATASPQGRPIRMLVPFPPGSAGDVIVRALAPTASEIGKQTIIIDNRGGAAGSIAAELAAKSTPDGATLFFGTTGALAINPAIYPKLAYDPVRDFAGVTLCATSTYTIVVSPALPVATLKEYVAYAKARPAELNLGSSGAGTSVHLSAELFNSVVGIKTTHVPYKGASEALTDLIAGRVHVMFASTSSAVPFVRGAKVKALAITGIERDPGMPELPTVQETGVADYNSVGFFGVLASVATPKAIIARLNETFVTALKTDEVKRKFASLGVAVAWSTPEAFGERIKTEKAKWTKVARAIGARAD
ncbi:MAG: Bug family tripartite tricarboxylate transporter substrate binding protein [Rhodospirillaceae bacterium]